MILVPLPCRPERRPLSRALVAALLLLSPSALADGWSNLGGNAGRNGLVTSIGPRSANPAWSNTDDFSIIAWHPFVEGERVFCVREAGFPANNGPANDAIVAYDIETGAELWRTTLPYGGDTSQEWIAYIAGVHDGRVYASRGQIGAPVPIYALDAATGAPVWTSTHATQAGPYEGIVFAPDGDLLVGDFTSVVRIEATDGSTVWNTARSCPVSGNCGVALGPDGVFLDAPAPGGNQVQKLDLATGAPLYVSPVLPGFTAQNAPFVSPDGGTVYYARSQNNPPFDVLYAFTDDGTALVERWSRLIAWTTSHEHGIGPDGSVYTFLPTDELARLDPATGDVLASIGPLTPLRNPNASPRTAVDGEGRVYVCNGWASTPSTGGRLWAFDADLTQTLFTVELDNPNAGGPSLGTRGTLIVADRVGVHAFRAADQGTPYCLATPNSTGLPARLSARGSAVAANNDLVLTAEQTPPGRPGLFFYGTQASQVPLGAGFRCIGGSTQRLQPLSFSNACGAVHRRLDLAAAPAQADITAQVPITMRFQFWFRDGMTSSNLTPGLAIDFL